MRVYPVSFNAITPGNDFTGTAATLELVVRTGGRPRHLTLREREIVGVESNQDALMIECSYTPTLAGLRPGSHSVTFKGQEYKIMSVDENSFNNRIITFMVGRNV